MTFSGVSCRHLSLFSSQKLVWTLGIGALSEVPKDYGLCVINLFCLYWFFLINSYLRIQHDINVVLCVRTSGRGFFPFDHELLASIYCKFVYQIRVAL